MAGRYKAYPKYEDSGVEWIDSMPTHWSSVSVRWSAKLYAGGTPSKDVESYWEDGTVPWLNSGAVNQRIVTEPSTLITEAAFKNSSAKWIPKGALVMALAGQGKTKGMVASLAIRTTCNQSMAAVVPSELRSSRYLFWWLDSNYQNIRNMSGGDHRDGLNLELLGNIQCPKPSLPEQKQIAQFLDHETGKIDLLIAKQQALIALLQEKRQAVISHAVTKGLNPEARMKDSGVEWLGQVPEHWNVARLKYYCSVKGRIGFRGYTVEDLVDENEGALVIGAAEIGSAGEITLNSPQYITWKKYYESPEIMIEQGMVLFVQRGSVGKVAAVPSGLGFTTINPSIIVLRDLVINAPFLTYWLSGSAIQSLVELQTSSTAVPMISQEQVGNYWQVIPPQAEQLEIMNFLDLETVRMDRLILQAEDAITLMQERRTALISATVTGKIDVRDWTAPAAQKQTN